ncbi:MAG: hypothetical protein NTZ27_04230 [Ignavibacteriales bacterium]|nr:hypothetical protein [Ignavibacteriales bacterium]
MIKETREKLAQLNMTFLKNDYPDKSTVDELGKLLTELKEVKTFPESISDSQKANEKRERLIESFNAFENFFKNNPEVDTLKKAFRVVNNEFNSLLGNYFLDELKKTSNKKIIVFSTSMSCECTLEMCYKQESEIQKLLKDNPGLFDYAVVDCFTNFDLQTKYEVGFIPVVLVMDEKGMEIKRFVRSENLFTELNSLLNTRRNK